MTECVQATTEVMREFGYDPKSITNDAQLQMKAKLWISANIGKLRKGHTNLFIAVKGTKFIKSDEDVEALVTYLKEKFNGKISDIVIEYIPEDDVLFIL